MKTELRIVWSVWLASLILLVAYNLANADIIASNAVGKVASVYFNHAGDSCPTVGDSLEVRVVAQEGPDGLVNPEFTSLINNEYDGLPDWSTRLHMLWPLDRQGWNANGPYERRIGGEGYVSFRNPEVFEWSWRIGGGAETLCQMLVADVVWDHEVMYYDGDADQDTLFDSRDLVAVFAASQYDDGIVGNSNWATGDWTGDYEFDSSDLVSAMISGRYVSGVGARAVPEPAAISLVLVGLMVFGIRRRF